MEVHDMEALREIEKFKCLPSRCFRQRVRLTGTNASWITVHNVIGIGQPRISERIAGISVNRLLEQLDTTTRSNKRHRVSGRARLGRVGLATTIPEESN